MTDPDTPVAVVSESASSIADGVERHLDPRAVRLDRILSWIFSATICLPLLVGLVIVLALAPLLAWAKGLLVLLWIAVTLGLAWLGYRWPEVEHRHTSYRVDAQGIEIKRGVFWRRVVTVPRSRVQHTDVAQGPIERTHGLGTVPLSLLVTWACFAARRHVAHMGWAVTDNAVLYRSGWLWRQVSIARFAKIQAVTLHESPFDRRNAMARVRVDTAGAGELSHRVDIPYLAKDTARELHGFLAAEAAGTELRW